MRFHRLTIVIDIIGIIGIFLAAIGFYFTNLTSSETAQLFGNLGIELIGSWISVRVLEFVLRKREDYKNARTGILRNLRFYLNYMRRMRANILYNDISHLRSELSYTEHVFVARKKYLYTSEIQKCSSAYNIVREFTKLSEDFLELDSQFNAAVSRLEYALREVFYKKGLSKLENSSMTMVRTEIHDLSRIISRDEMHISDIAISRAEMIETQISLIVGAIIPEASNFIESTKKVVEAKVAIYNKWEDYEIMVRSAEDDIRKETPES